MIGGNTRVKNVLEKAPTKEITKCKCGTSAAKRTK